MNSNLIQRLLASVQGNKSGNNGSANSFSGSGAGFNKTGGSYNGGASINNAVGHYNNQQTPNVDLVNGTANQPDINPSVGSIEKRNGFKPLFSNEDDLVDKVEFEGSNNVKQANKPEKNNNTNSNKPTEAQQKIIDDTINSFAGANPKEDTTEKLSDGTTRRIIKNNDGERMIIQYDIYGRVSSIEKARPRGRNIMPDPDATYHDGNTTYYTYDDDGNVYVSFDGHWHQFDDIDEGWASDLVAWLVQFRIEPDGTMKSLSENGIWT